MAGITANVSQNVNANQVGGRKSFCQQLFLAGQLFFSHIYSSKLNWNKTETIVV